MSWLVREIGSEVKIRLARLPGLRVDVTRSEAVALSDELSKVLMLPAVAVPRIPWRLRLGDWYALLVWKYSAGARLRRDAARLRAQKMLNGGGWS